LLERAEILPLNILDQRLGEVMPLLLVLVPDHGRYFRQTGDSGRPPASFSGYQLETVIAGSNQYWLQNSDLFDRGREILESGFVKGGPGLAWIGPYLVQGDQRETNCRLA